MSNGDYFSSNVVIQAVYSIGVNETISNPDTSLHTIFDFPTNLQLQYAYKYMYTAAKT